MDRKSGYVQQACANRVFHFHLTKFSSSASLAAQSSLTIELAAQLEAIMSEDLLPEALKPEKCESQEPKIDLLPFDKNKPDDVKIDEGYWVPCRICQNAFRRITLTRTYCNSCKVGFCNGNHGNFQTTKIGQSGYKVQGRCVQCGPKARDYQD